MHLWHPAREINRGLRNNYSIRLQKHKSHVNNPPSTRDDTDLRGKKKSYVALLKLRANCCFSYKAIRRLLDSDFNCEWGEKLGIKAKSPDTNIKQ